MRSTKELVISALFTALIISGTYIRVPIGPVPIVLATLFVLLGGLMQRLHWALASVGMYLFLGAMGLPVFSAGGGIGYFAGPTGGFLTGYLFAAVVVNLVSTISPRNVGRDIVAVAAASFAIYLPGVPWLKVSLGLEWSAAITVGLIPFLVGDAIKATVACAIWVAVKRTYPELVPRHDSTRRAA